MGPELHSKPSRDHAISPTTLGSFWLWISPKGGGLQRQSNSRSHIWGYAEGEIQLFVLSSYASIPVHLRREVGGWGAAVLNPNT